VRIALCGPVQVEGLTPWLGAGGEHPALPRGLGGVPVTYLARTLLERGYELVVVTLDPSVEREVHLTGPQISLHVGPYRPRNRARDFFRVERVFLERALATEGPDVIHAHWTYEFALGALRVGPPTIVTVHDWAPTILAMNPHPYRFVRLLMALRTFVRGSRFTAVSPYIRDRLHRIGLREVVVVPNGLPDDLFAGGDVTVDQREPVVVSVNQGFGRLKNVHALLAAWPLIREDVPAARLLLVGGDFDPGGRAQRWVERRHPTGGMEFVGEVEHSEARRLLAQADILVHPSREESFGLVLVEAMAAGTPVIGGNRSGAVPWVLGHGRAGALTDVRSPRSIADATVALLKDGEARARFVSEGRKRAWEEFRMSTVADRYLEAYAKALGTVAGSR
jgi:L-malate glycosyltransferase